ncbi:MAG: extracellular solute-binding protein, partial [Alphaproteobacteria bacterium]|nr:extracellular solute-binding protein [Alphaproteobacteria bacterium]
MKTISSLLAIAFLFVFNQAEASHGISLYNVPLKYGPDFKHFDYVNPDVVKGGALNLSAINTFDSFNPYVVKGTPAAGLTPLYPSLLHATLSQRAHDEAFSDYGYVAESYEVDPDNLWVIFHLRQNCTFHDGSAITADDVIYTFNMLLQKGSPLYKAYYHSVKDVIKIDANTVKFTFKDATSKEQVMIMGEMPVLSKAYFEKKGFENTVLEPPLGSGPYRIDSFVAGQYVIYKRVQNWWGENLPVNKGRYNFDTIRFKYFKDQTVAFEAFKSNDYDFRHEASAKNWAKSYDFKAFVDGDVKKLEVVNKTPSAAQVLTFNTRRAIFKDRDVRAALVYAYDFEWLNKNLFY